MGWDSITEYEQWLRLSEDNPQEAYLKFMDKFSSPIRKRSKYPCIPIEKRMYNMAVFALEQKDAIGCQTFLVCAVDNVLSKKGLVGAEIFNPKEIKHSRFTLNVQANLGNMSPFPLNPIHCDDAVPYREKYDIYPGHSYEGAIFFPYLLSWIQSGHIQLLGA